MEQVGTLTLDPSEAPELLELVSDEYHVEEDTVHDDGNINFVVSEEEAVKEAKELLDRRWEQIEE